MQKRKLGRLELLQWINGVVDADYARVEDLSDGVAYCQVFDALFPGRLPLHKLVFDPKRTEEKNSNLRLFSDSVKQVGFEKTIPHARLASGKFAEHAELLQDLYDFCHRVSSTAGQSYPGYEIRAAAAARADKSLCDCVQLGG